MEYSRDLSIDRFRGFAVISMVLIQLWRDFPCLEFLSRLGAHRSEEGLMLIENLMFADIFAPMFLFAIALTYKSSFDRRCVLYGKKAAERHFIVRYISIMGIGGILRAIESFIFLCSKGESEHKIDYFFFVGLLVLLCLNLIHLILLLLKVRWNLDYLKKIKFLVLAYIACLCVLATARDFFAQLIFNTYEHDPWGYWEALQAIGGAGLIALPVIKLDTKKRFLLTTIIFVLYSIFHGTGNHAAIMSVYAQQGGFLGVVGQSCILLFGTILADLYAVNKKILTKYIYAVFCLGLLSILAIQLVQPTMRSVSPSYIILNLFISSGVFLIFLLFRKKTSKFEILALFGKNSLLIYLLQYILIYGAKELIGYDLLIGFSDIQAISFSVIMFLFLLFVVYVLNRKKIIIKL